MDERLLTINLCGEHNYIARITLLLVSENSPNRCPSLQPQIESICFLPLAPAGTVLSLHLLDFSIHLVEYYQLHPLHQ